MKENEERDIRAYLHQLIDRAPKEKLRVILAVLRELIK